MTDDRDVLDQIRAYAPPAAGAQDRHRVLQRLSDGSLDGQPRFTARLRRRSVVAIAAAVLLGTGGVATAAGWTPGNPWRFLFGPTAPHGSQYAADPATARKVFAIPGPDGQEFAGWTIENKVGWRCVSAFFEPLGTSEISAQRVGNSAGGCALTPHHDDRLFGDGTDASLGEAPDARVNFVYPAGAATRATLVVSDGRTYPVQVQHGWLGGWYTLAQVPIGTEATVVAYGRDGRELGHLTVLDQAGCPDSTPC